MKTNSIKPLIEVTLSPSFEDCQIVDKIFNEKYGEVNYFDFRDEYAEIYKQYLKKFEFINCTYFQAETFAEKLRIQYPDRHVNLYSDFDENKNPKSYIGNTTWNVQMKMFPEYPVYTPEGLKQKKEALLKYHAHLVEIGNWSKDYKFESYLNEIMSNQFKIA